MRDEGWTILCPQLSPIHFELIVAGVRSLGYNVELLPSVDHGAVEAGLKYVNNDVCYPSVLVTGQVMEAIDSGKYDLSKTAVIVSQTGGGCRATNYIALIRKALKDDGHPDIPVISLTLANTGESNPGFKIDKDMMIIMTYGAFIGDVLMQCLLRTRPYEAEKGSANKLFRKWMDYTREHMIDMNFSLYSKIVPQMIEEFDNLPLVNDRMKPRVGVVGEILVKYHPTANNQIVKTIEEEGCEAVVPGFVDFFMYTFENKIVQTRIGRSRKGAIENWGLIQLVNFLRRPMVRAMEKSKRFEPPVPIDKMVKEASEVIDPCCSMGEGWLLTAEMKDLIKSGAPNIVCTQPFGCLPNHVCGKATIKELRRQHPGANIVAVDYDPGASEVNQLNRIKLMIAVAFTNFEEEHPEAVAIRDAAKREEHERILAERRAKQRKPEDELLDTFSDGAAASCGTSEAACPAVDDLVASMENAVK
jgi:predicted nucleotide-binding protein (sugar kinase/HSP70/actin superfamily)